MSAAIFALALCGCGREYKISPVTEKFSCNFKVVSDDTEVYKGAAQFGEKGKAEFSFSFPESVNGLQLKDNGEGALVSYGGIESAENETAPDSSCFGTVRDALLDISKSGITLSAENLSFSGSCGENKYRVRFRPDGFPEEIILKDENIKVKMSDFQYIF